MTVPPLQRILFVEDDPDIQVIAQLALEEVGGFTVHTCSSGHEAVAAAPAFLPDLVLLDVMMPGMDGPDTLHALRAIPEVGNVPAIFMTARVQTHEVSNYKEMGAVDVIAKPFDPMTLSIVIMSIWEAYHVP